MSLKHAIEMTFCGNSPEEVKKHICEFAALHGGDPLKNAETEALLKEIRDRLAKNGQVVKVVPFSNEENSSADSAVETTSIPQEKRGRGRPRKPVEEAAKPADAVKEAEQTIAENAPSVPSTTESSYSPATQAIVDGMKRAAEDMVPATIDEVKKALNEFAALYGQVEARRIMSEQGGSPALKDVPAEKYGAVIKGLQGYQPAAKAA